MKKSKPYKQIIIGVIIIAVVAISIIWYWLYSTFHPSTDNAYINAGITYVSPKASGYIKKIYVNNNQYVKNGDLLLEIDPSSYNIALKKSIKDYKLSQQQYQASIQQIEIAKANLVKAELQYELTKKIALRYSQLYQKKSGSLQDKEKYTTQYKQAQQAKNQAKLDLKKSEINSSIMKTQSNIAKIALDNAKLNKSYTKVFSQSDGYIGNMNLQSGQLISQGQRLFIIIDNNNWWVDVNLKETQLSRIKIGQIAQISLDMYSHTYKGSVISISYASGNTYSLLPAQNASGNWVKVTQRFTVKVKLKNNKDFPLRVGASANVSINTTN